MVKKKKSKIADEAEIMEMYTAILRRDISDYAKIGQDVIDIPIKPADMMKAAEMLLKRLDAAAVPADEPEEKFGVIIMPSAEMCKEGIV